ncbi:MAG: GMC family oxidoreductase N-terminal domain-containing protein [Gammaproteobacteria bacterium]|nr:GMC family oxidoreductase N-terminal domain-containing protein [Gammaproteobacteria bacterium]
MASADYIVVGAGSAGCVVARRLVDAGFTVILLEAGPPDYALDFRIHMPAALSEVLGSTTYNWAFHSAPEATMNGRRMYCPRGKTLGGSSAINGMIFVRGHAADFDRWAQLSGFPEWDYAHCLPFFKRSESVAYGESAWRGRDGPMRISRGEMANPLFEAFLQAGREAGHRVSTDLNGEHQEGVGPFDRTIFAGRRWSAARGYLDPVRRDGRLTIQTGTIVRRILPDATDPGVEIERGGEVQTLRADPK